MLHSPSHYISPLGLLRKSGTLFFRQLSRMSGIQSNRNVAATVQMPLLG